mmetsp:Transcript_10210/g.11313  ORF Transcript_10210/g.11313 Transcript_10210/m.11313 type:complete len:420 (-) Transcript_10210:12-1271(-)
MNFLQKLFIEKLVVDSFDDPIFTLKLPSIFTYEKIQFSIFLPKLEFYNQLTTLLVIQTSMAAIAGVFMYYFIILPQAKINCNSMSSMTPFLVGFGVVFPFVVLQPIYLINYLSIESLALRMMILALPTVSTLRCLEAMFGFTPRGPKKNLKSYLIYSSCLMGIKFDPKTNDLIPVTVKFIRMQLLTFGRDYVFVVSLMSILKPKDYEFFDVKTHADSLDHSFYELLSWRHLLNNYLVALLLSVSLSQSTLGVSIMYNLVYGYETLEVVRNPILKSTSPSDFWGKRWNILIHQGLKNGVYKPMRQHFSTFLSVLATFIVSGILHEYINYVFFSNFSMILKYKNIYFFGWNGLLILGQHTFGNLKIFRVLNEHLPRCLSSFLVILSALPLAQFFTGDWIKHGYFDHVNVCLPSIVRIDPRS